MQSNIIRILAPISFALLFFVSPFSARAAGGPVFSWYMTPFYTYSSPGDSDAVAIAGYKRDIQDAQASGMDGFVLYFGNNPNPYMYYNTRNMFEAAKQLHDADPSKPPFWLVLGPEASPFVDLKEVFPGTTTNYLVYYLNSFASHPNYYHYQNKAVLAPFLGIAESQQSEWVNYVFTPLRNQGIDLFFVPAIFNTDDITTVVNGTHTTTFTPWAQTNIGSLNIWTGNTPTNDINGNNVLANILQLNGKPFVAGVSMSNYWSVNNSASAHVYFEHYGGEGPAQEWQNAISNNPIFVITTTWNDYTESYNSPVDIPNVPTVLTGYGIEDLLKPHVGYAELGKYYIEWYKTGVQPTNTKDKLIYFYRTHAKNLVASNDTSTQTFNPGSPGDTVPDVLFVTTQLTVPATLRVTTGGVVTNYNLPSGMNFTRIPFSPGAPKFEVIRNGTTIISTTGEPILSSIQKYNFVYTTGFAYAQTPYSGTPIAIPGTIQAEDFDNGGEGVAYHDTDTVNTPGQYRATGVDIKLSTDTGGGYTVGYINTGEWLEYTINVATTGNYNIDTRVTTPFSGKTFHIEIDGVDRTGSLSVPVTGAWDTTYGTVTKSNVNLTAGQHTMRFYADTDSFDVNYFNITAQTPLPGDLNLDHIVNSLDWSYMNSVWFTADALADINDDGIVNGIDFSALNKDWFKTW
jgi:hypothetical protein